MPVNPYHLSVPETFRLPETRPWRLWKVKRGYVVDALGRTMLLPTDVDRLKKMRMQEIFLNTKRYLGMVRLLKPKILLTLTPGLSFTMYLSLLTGSRGHL